MEDKFLFKSSLAQTIKQELEKENNSLPLKTGFELIDNNVSGLKQGQLFFACARPAIGKTTFLVNIIYNIFELKQLQEDEYILFFSLEASVLDIFKKLIALKNSSNVKNITFRKDFETQANEYANENNLIIYNRASFGSCITPIDIKNTLDILATKNKKVKAIFIDYFQLLDFDDKTKNYLQHERYSKVSNELKNIALKYNVNVFSLAQLSRDYEKRASKMPTFADIKGTGSLEQDADVIAFLYDKNVSTIDNGRLLYLTLAKNRNGNTITDNLVFDLEYGKISQMVKNKKGDNNDWTQNDLK